MPMINLSIGFDMTNGKDPAGMCVLYRDEKGESHIQNMILGYKAELIYKLLTTPSAEYSMRTCGPGMDYAEIEFKG
jgi:hypothetical protein